MTFTLLVFILNEIEGLRVVLPRIQKEWVDEFILLDGGSTDGSVEFAESLGFRVTRQKSKGLLEALREGIGLVRTDCVIPFTPDNNMIPEKIPELVAKAKEGYDMVICSRYYGGAKSQDDNLITGFGNWMFTSIVNVLFGTRYTDLLGLYRVFRTDLIRRLGITIQISIDTQLCIRCATHGFKVTEIGGDEPKRIGGKSSRKIIKNGLIEVVTITKEFIFKKKILQDYLKSHASA